MNTEKYTCTLKSASAAGKHYARSDITAAHTSQRETIQHPNSGKASAVRHRLGSWSIRPRQLLRIAVIITASLFYMLTDIWYLKSGSMAPDYPIGSVIVTSRYARPVIGSVCAYRHNGITIIHRIISESDDGFILKGDANNVEDPTPVAADDIEGIMIFGLRPIFQQHY